MIYNKQEDWMRDINGLKVKLEHWNTYNTETQEQLKSLYPEGYISGQRDKRMMGQELTKEALNQINTVKQDSYGKPEDSFGSIARRWTEYLQNRYGTGKSVTGRTVSELELTPTDVAFMMMELKMARESNNHKRDNLVDLIGYTCLKEGLDNET